MEKVAALLVLLGLAVSAPAVETQNGLQLSIAPKTISRNDTRYAYYFTDRAINRMMALQIVAKNVSTKAMPEGSVSWKILVIKSGYYNSAPTELYEGTEKLPALKTAASQELLVGSAQITGWRDASSQRKDKLEYKITVTHDGKLTSEVSSVPAFDALAKNATKRSGNP